MVCYARTTFDLPPPPTPGDHEKFLGICCTLDEGVLVFSRNPARSEHPTVLKHASSDPLELIGFESLLHALDSEFDCSSDDRCSDVELTG